MKDSWTLDDIVLQALIRGYIRQEEFMKNKWSMDEWTTSQKLDWILDIKCKYERERRLLEE